MFNRYLTLQANLEKKSLLLLGPRQTGKSTLITQQLPGVYTVNLAERDTYRRFSAHPELLRQQLPEQCPLFVVDEAQLLPEIFDEVQVILDRNKSVRALLTGSSSRKLRRKGVNLLPGRIWSKNLHPLISAELPTSRVADRLVRGSLPGIIDSEHFREELLNYVGIYLEQEIRAEGVTRSVGDFSRFLTAAALSNAEQVNYSKISNDTTVKINTVRAYYEILQDTLLGYLLEPFRGTKHRKAVSTPKFYLFDTGVVNGILNRFEVTPQTEIYGKMLEHLLFLELKAFLDYERPGAQLNYWRSLSRIEVDFLINEEIAIEVKSGTSVSLQDEKPLRILAEEIALKRRIIVCNEPLPRRTESGTEIMPVEHFCAEVWSGSVC